IRNNLIKINKEEQIQIIKKYEKDILEINFNKQYRHLIGEFISDSGLPKVLQHQEKEVNEPLVLNNGTKIVSTRIPLINEQQHLIGAFAIFKDSQEILRLAE